jgi:hypothetical protein
MRRKTVVGYGGFWRRFAAALIDAAIFIPVNLALELWAQSASGVEAVGRLHPAQTRASRHDLRYAGSARRPPPARRAAAAEHLIPFRHA